MFELKHPNRSYTSFNHSLAVYPLQWKDYLISERKICLQFTGVQCKTRVNQEKNNDLKKTTRGTYEMPIDAHGTSINTLAIGIPLCLYPEVLFNILKAVKEHAERFKEYNLKEMMLEYADLIKESLHE